MRSVLVRASSEAGEAGEVAPPPRGCRPAACRWRAPLASREWTAAREWIAALLPDALTLLLLTNASHWRRVSSSQLDGSNASPPCRRRAEAAEAGCRGRPGGQEGRQQRRQGGAPAAGRRGVARGKRRQLAGMVASAQVARSARRKGFREQQQSGHCSERSGSLSRRTSSSSSASAVAKADAAAATAAPGTSARNGLTPLPPPPPLEAPPLLPRGAVKGTPPAGAPAPVCPPIACTTSLGSTATPHWAPSPPTSAAAPPPPPPATPPAAPSSAAAPPVAGPPAPLRLTAANTELFAPSRSSAAARARWKRWRYRSYCFAARARCSAPLQRSGRGREERGEGRLGNYLNK